MIKFRKGLSPGLVIPTQNFPQAKAVVCKDVIRVNTCSITLSLAFGEIFAQFREAVGVMW